MPSLLLPLTPSTPILHSPPYKPPQSSNFFLPSTHPQPSAQSEPRQSVSRLLLSSPFHFFISPWVFSYFPASPSCTLVLFSSSTLSSCLNPVPPYSSPQRHLQPTHYVRFASSPSFPTIDPLSSASQCSGRFVRSSLIHWSPSSSFQATFNKYSAYFPGMMYRQLYTLFQDAWPYFRLSGSPTSGR